MKTTGRRIRITYLGRTVDGWVKLGSENAKSLMLGFDAMLGGYVESMPVLQNDEGVYHDLIAGYKVTIEWLD